MSSEDSIVENGGEVEVGSACQSIKGGRIDGDSDCYLAAMGAQFRGEQDEMARDERRDLCLELDLR